MVQRLSDLIPGFHLDLFEGGAKGYELVCVQDGEKAVRLPGKFKCPKCGTTVDTKPVKMITFGLMYGLQMSGTEMLKMAQALRTEGFTTTGRFSTKEPNMSEVDRAHEFNYPLQANFAELEMRALLQQHGEVADATAKLPNHQDEEVRSEKDDDAGRNHCPGSDLCKTHCSDRGKPE